jgi:ribonuclease G
MAKNILVISCDFRETRAALIENGIIAELHIERKGAESGTVGNVYLGKVTRVLPGLQAAFIDIGQERAAFLHVEDLIRPDDFDEYLAGGRKLARGEERSQVTEESDSDAEPETLASPEDRASEAAVPSEPSLPPPSPPVDQDEDEDDEREDEEDDDADDDQDAAEAESAAQEAEEAAASSDEPRAGEGGGIDDLETTVAYGPDWPLPPPRAAAKKGPGQNGSSSAKRALSRRSEPPVSEEPPSTEAAPPSAPLFTPAIVEETSSVALIGAAASSREVIAPLAGESDRLFADEDDELDDEDREEPAAHSLQSQPTLDELPSSDSDRPEAAGPEGAPAEDDDDDFGDMPGFTISEPGEPVPRAPAPRGPGGAADRERGERGGRRRRRGRGRGNERPQGLQSDAGRGRGGSDRGGRDAQRGRRPGGRDGNRPGGRPERPGAGGLPGRLSKSTPIREVVKEGQEIIVQVTKDPIGTKGARCSSHISLPGRYVVYLPTVDHIGISKRIGNDKERARLREAIEAMKPPSGGLIVRTVAEGLTKKGLKQDIGYLVRLWGEVAKKREGARAPHLLSSELDLVLKVARDLFTDEVDEVVIDDKQQYERLRSFVEMFAPERLKDVKHYTEEEPIFDEYGIEDEIGRALSRKVPLPSGGYLIIDQAEALTAIDVNTGRFVGKGSKDMEETILKTNLEAVHEIAYQLRFRNIGGLIILDLIDMEQHKNREKVRRTLEELLQKDKAKTTLNRISDLGLIEMTRKRTRESLGRLLHEPCFYCDGTGQLQSKETIAFEILREIRRKRSTLPGYSVLVNAHPAVADVLNSTEKAAVQDAENKFMRKIIVTPRKEYHLEQFDIVGK